MNEIKVKFIVERDGIKYLTSPYVLDGNGLPSYSEILWQMDGDGCSCDLNESDAFCDGSCSEWHDATVIGAVQFTGQEDGNGNDIYFGDIYSDTHGIWLVKWDNEKGCINMDLLNTDNSGHLKRTIIGNETENPAIANPLPY